VRILLISISYSPNLGGVETHLDDLTESLSQDASTHLDVLTYQPITTAVKAPAFEERGNLRIFRIPWFGQNLFHKLESRPLFQFAYLAPRLLLGAFWRVILEGKYDVIHAHGLIAIWVAGWIRRLLKVPVLGSLHAVYAFSHDSTTARRIIRVLERCDRTLTLSDASVHQLLKFGLKRESVGRFTYWVNQSVFCPKPREAARKTFDLPPAAKICLFVGRLIPVKGVRLVLDLARELPELTFVIAGDGPLSGECREAAEKLDNLFFTGPRNQQELSLLYSAADVLLVPSLNEEGFGRVVCESLSCGTPVIASNRGGLREIITSDTGVLVEPNLQAFKAAIPTFLQTEDFELYGAKCLQYAKTAFSPENAREIHQELVKLAETRETKRAN
jgi:glycosyltransferase involved in cell wall biosynthesis